MITKPKKKKISVKRRNPTISELKLLESVIINQNNKVLVLMNRNNTLSLQLYGKLVPVADRFGLVVNDYSSSLVFSLEDIAKVYMTPKKIVEIVIV